MSVERREQSSNKLPWVYEEVSENFLNGTNFDSFITKVTKFLHINTGYFECKHEFVIKCFQFGNLRTKQKDL